MSGNIKIEVELSNEEAWAFAEFLKRAGHDDFLRHVEGHLNPQDRDSKAYEMLHAGEAIREALAQAGVAPR